MDVRDGTESKYPSIVFLSIVTCSTFSKTSGKLMAGARRAVGSSNPHIPCTGQELTNIQGI